MSSVECRVSSVECRVSSVESRRRLPPKSLNRSQHLGPPATWVSGCLLGVTLPWNGWLACYPALALALAATCLFVHATSRRDLAEYPPKMTVLRCGKPLVF